MAPATCSWRPLPPRCGQPLAEAARDAARQVTEALARTRELGWEELAVE